MPQSILSVLARLVSISFLGLLILPFVILGCASNAANPLAANISGNALHQTNDPLAIGTKPIAPAKQRIPSFIHNTKSSLSPIMGDPRDFVAMLNQGAGVITIWASAPASWVWAHSAALHTQFGDAFNWIMQPIGNGFIRFINKLTHTCLNVYGQGVIHYPCDPKNPNQFFRLLPMQNGAVAIQSASTNLCLQTSMRTKVNHPLVLNKCLKVANSEQQWFIIPPFAKPTPILYP